MKYFHLCTVAALSAISTVMLSACQKPHQVSCGDATVQNQLLELTANIAQSNFISAKIIKISEIQPATEATNLSCQTTILYTYPLFPKSSIQQNYAFSINNQQQITEFDTDKTQQQKFSLWKSKLSLVISWQKNSNTILAIIQTPHPPKTGNQIQQLVLNDRIISLPPGKNYSTIVFNQAYNLGKENIYLLSAYYNDARDENIAHSYFISIESRDKFMLTTPFNYQPNSMQAQKDGIYFKGFPKFSFAETDDVPAFRYSAGKISLIKDVKALSYYRQKFATYSATKILKQIKNDGCLNGDQFYLSDICSAKINTYCFEYNAMVKPKKDKTFWLLKEMCQIQQY